MRITDAIAAKAANGKQFISLEFFPPKEKTSWPSFFEVVGRLRAIDPLFVSVTYGAGGSTQAHTLEIVSRLKQEYAMEPMAHLTCVGAAESSLRSFMDGLAKVGVQNVLALRGDPPKGQTEFVPDSEEFRYASDLVRFIKAAYPEFGVGVAGYPEKHPQAPCMADDLANLKLKLDAGGDFIISQLFFDNAVYFDFVGKLRAMGVSAPVVPGVLPILNLSSVKRILSLCGASISPEYLEALEKAESLGGPEAVAEFGTQFAKRQCKELLAGGAPGVHLYTLNKADACLKIAEGLL